MAGWDCGGGADPMGWPYPQRPWNRAPETPCRQTLANCTLTWRLFPRKAGDMHAQKIIPRSNWNSFHLVSDYIMIISRHFEIQVLQSQIQPLHSARRLRSLRGAASSPCYVANENMTDVRTFQIFTFMSPVWQVDTVKSAKRGGTSRQGPPLKGAHARSPGKPRGVVVRQILWDPRSIPVMRGMGASRM